MFATAHAPRVARGLARVASARVAGPRGFATAAADDTPGGIFRSSVANKSGLSHALDAVMREGHHDMRAFGRGTLAALASRGAYAKFTAAHFHFYSELERRLDDAARGPNPTPTGSVWRRFSEDLRRAPALERDLALLLDTTPGDHPVSPATAAYMRAIATAAEREESSCSRTGDGELRVDATRRPRCSRTSTRGTSPICSADRCWDGRRAARSGSRRRRSSTCTTCSSRRGV